MNCTKCNHPNPEDSRFCENCGMPLHSFPSSGDTTSSQQSYAEVVGKASTLKEPKKTGGRIGVLVVVILLGCLCITVIGGGLLVLLNQNGSLFNKIFNEQPSAAAIPTHTSLEDAATPGSAQEELPQTTVETPQTQPLITANTILVNTTSGIFAVNEETFEATQISYDLLDSPWDLKDGLSAEKKYFAYFTGWGGASVNPMLVVLDIKNQTSIVQLELSGASIQANMGDEVGNPAFEALRAMQMPGSIAWSPDGTRLAFIAARDAESADVYLFNTADESVTRLTEETGHAYELHWSPDGQLLEFLSAQTFGTGAGSVMESLWVYDFQSSQSQLLENLESGGETFLAWTDTSHFLISSWGTMCEGYSLRLVNAARSFNEIIVDGCFTGIAYDPENKQGMFAVTEFNYEYCNCGEPLDPGLRIFGEGIGYPAAGEIGTKKFEQLDAYTVSFVPQGNLFIIYGYDSQQFIFDESFANLEIPAEVVQFTPYAAPNGAYWAWSSRAKSGLWVTTERNMNPVGLSVSFSGVPQWSKDGQTIYFFENNQLFSASAPQFSTKTLITEISGVEILGLIN